VETKHHIFLTSELDSVDGSASHPYCFSPGTHRIGGWVSHRFGLDTMVKRKNPIIAAARN